MIGATHIYAWANSEATTLYSFVVNNGVNDLIADNTFAVSNRGLDFINGGTTSTFTINGNVVTRRSLRRGTSFGGTRSRPTRKPATRALNRSRLKTR